MEWDLLTARGVWRWMVIAGLAMVGLGLVMLGVWEKADLGIGAAFFVAVLLMIEGIVRLAFLFRRRRRHAHGQHS